MILESEHDVTNHSNLKVVATFKEITALQIRELHTRLTEETVQAVTTRTDERASTNQV